MRNFVIALAIVAVVGAGISFASPASAVTIDELQAQIRGLLSNLNDLTRQLNIANGNANSTVSVKPDPTNFKHRICTILARNLAQGSQGDDVMSLQEFLRAEGHLSANATGYFGPATRAAVARWQAQEGISAAGAFGPMSRERLKMWCGGADRFGATPQRGEAPLEVTFKTNVEIANSRFVADAGDYKIVFGDGKELKIPCDGDEAFCKGPHTIKYTYEKDGTYTAQLVHYGYFGVPGPDGGMPSQVVGRVQIFVGDKVACTKEYKPVCGEIQIQCITTPCNPIQKTYGNRCMMEAESAKFLYEGACRPDNANPEKDLRCKSWYDGCNTCSRETPTGPAMCTLRACTPESMTKPYCTSYFDKSTPVACTMDAKQCPDGKWVGRTGPKCEFVCS